MNNKLEILALDETYGKRNKDLEAIQNLQSRHTARQILKVFESYIVKDNTVTYQGLKNFYDSLKGLAD